MALGVGILGAGAIAPPYYTAVRNWPQLELVACASKSGISAEAAATKYGITAMPFEAMLASPDIDVIVNLTPAQAHHDTSRAILRAGKHLYSEKPLSATLAEAEDLVQLAEANGLRIGCAPDTFLGAAHQEARAAIDSGLIGRAVAGSVFLGNTGSEAWHPAPAPFYATGGGPMADHGPYYITQLVNLLGPVASVVAQGGRPRSERHDRQGRPFPVEVATTASAVLAFENGALITLTMSWDIIRHDRRPIEIYGTDGTLVGPDPNWSDGVVSVSTKDGWQTLDHAGRCFHAPTMITFQGQPVGYYRMCGLADMADAIAQDRPHRADGRLALHVVAVIDAVRAASESGTRTAVAHRCERPAPVADDISHAAGHHPFGGLMLDARTLF